MKFEQYIKIKKKSIQKEIQKTFLVWQKDVDKKAPDINELVKLLWESNQGGKYIRGTLVHLGYDIYATRRSLEINKIAAAYEILQTSLLIHDDVIDKSVLRRGKETVVQQLGADHYAVSQAICLGDIGFFLATQLISTTTFSTTIKTKILSHFSQIVLDTIAGQMLDVKLTNKIGHGNETAALKIAELKTARYTIFGPLVLGALAAEAESRFLSDISTFGKNLGIAYQIQDDILGIYGDEKRVGKSVTSDIEEGKNTLLIVHALAHASKKKKALLMQYYGQGKITQQQHALIRQMFVETGALAYAEKKAQAYIDKAQRSISQVTHKKKQRDLLNNFLEMITTREK